MSQTKAKDVTEFSCFQRGGIIWRQERGSREQETALGPQVPCIISSVILQLKRKHMESVRPCSGRQDPRAQQFSYAKWLMEDSPGVRSANVAENWTRTITPVRYLHQHKYNDKTASHERLFTIAHISKGEAVGPKDMEVWCELFTACHFLGCVNIHPVLLK